MNMPASSPTTRRSPANLHHGRRGERRQAVAPAAGRGLRPADRFADRRHEECRPARGGSITAAQFLQRFVDEGVAWAHLDIAGMAWSRQGRHDLRQGRDRLWRAAARPIHRRHGRRLSCEAQRDAGRFLPARRERQLESVIAADRGKVARRRAAAAGGGRRRRRCSPGSTACCGTRARPASCRTASPAAPTMPRQPILLSTSTDAPNLARNIADRRRRVARGGAGLRPRLLSVRRRHARRRARLAWKLLAGRDGVERHYWAQEDGKWVEEGLSLALGLPLAARGAANPNP